VAMIIGGAFEFAHSDGGHFHESAFDGGFEGGVPLDAIDEERSVAFVRGAVDVGFDAFRRVAEGHGVHGTDDGAADFGLRDFVVREDVDLAFGGSSSVTAHGGEDEGLAAEVAEMGDGGADDGGDVGDASASGSYCDSGSRLESGSGLRLGELLADGGGYVGERAGGEMLADGDESGESHCHQVSTGIVQITIHNEILGGLGCEGRVC
jgi:hypothetical protein